MTVFQKKIAVAILIGFALVVAALATGKYSKVYAPAINEDTTPSVAVVERQFIKTTDVDKNGVPDWQEGFEKKISTTTASTTYEIPDTLTAQFGIRLYNELSMADSFGMLGEVQEELLKNGITTLRRKASDEGVSTAHIKVFTPTNTEVLHDYGNLVAQIILSNQTGLEHELEIFSEVLDTEDEARLEDLKPIQTNYSDIVSLLSTMSVPDAYLTQHVNLMNAFNSLAHDVEGMLLLFEDPLYTYLRYTRFDDDALRVETALTALYGALYLQDEIRYETGEPVRELIQYTN